MEEVRQLINWLLIILPSAAGVRIILCLATISTDPDSEQSCKKRIRNAVVFTIIGECAMGLISSIAGYFS